ncbi:MAG: nucleotidyltransferase family protein [Pedobacter sp.]
MLSPMDSLFLALCDPESIGPSSNCRFSTQDLIPAELCRKATFHGVHGLLLANLQNPAWQDSASREWYEAMQKELTPIVRADRARGLALRAQGERILQVLRASNIPVQLIKGADFADHLYPRPELRSFTDIDLLVRPEDFQSAQDLLLEWGCQQHHTGTLKHAATYGETAFTSKVAGMQLRVELHWNLVNSPALQKAMSVTLNDLLDEHGTLRHEGRLLLAAIHAGTGHQFDRLKFLLDLRQIFRRLSKQSNLPWLSERITRTGCRQVMATACWLVENLFQCNDARQSRLHLGIKHPALLWRWILSPGLVLRAHQPNIADALRKNLYRQHLKNDPVGPPPMSADTEPAKQRGPL